MQRKLNDRITVSGQIDPDTIPDILAQGFDVVVDARPDAEVPDTHGSDAMRKRTEDAGGSFHYIPVTPGQIPSEEDAATFIAALRRGKLFAYCGSGPRAIVLASFAAAAEHRDVDSIIEEARTLGIDLSQARDLLAERGAKSA